MAIFLAAICLPTIILFLMVLGMFEQVMKGPRLVLIPAIIIGISIMSFKSW